MIKALIFLVLASSAIFSVGFIESQAISFFCLMIIMFICVILIKKDGVNHAVSEVEEGQ